MQKTKSSCKTCGCFNKGEEVLFAGKRILLCKECKLALFKALLCSEVPKGTTSKFKI